MTDSTGAEVEKILISSGPDGYILQKRLNKMPVASYTPEPENERSRPVRVKMTGKILPRRQLQDAQKRRQLA